MLPGPRRMPRARIRCEGAVPVGGRPHPLVPGQGRVQGAGRPVPVTGRGRGAGEFLAGEAPQGAAARPGQVACGRPRSLPVRVERAPHQLGSRAAQRGHVTPSSPASRGPSRPGRRGSRRGQLAADPPGIRPGPQPQGPGQRVRLADGPFGFQHRQFGPAGTIVPELTRQAAVPERFQPGPGRAARPRCASMYEADPGLALKSTRCASLQPAPAPCPARLRRRPSRRRRTRCRWPRWPAAGRPRGVAARAQPVGPGATSLLGHRRAVGVQLERDRQRPARTTT